MATKTLDKNTIFTNEKKRQLKKLGKWGAIQSPLLHEATLAEGPSSLAKRLALGDVGIDDIAKITPLWEKPQHIIFAMTLAKASSDITLKKAVASLMKAHPHGTDAAHMLTYQERAEEAVLALVEHAENSYVASQVRELERDARNLHMADVLADLLMSMASVCGNEPRKDLFESVAKNLEPKYAHAKKN